jgi:CRP-like cAMP-binding protein
MENLIRMLQSVHQLSDALVEHLLFVLNPKELKRRQYLLQHGQVCREICFIETGLLRCFYLKEDQEVSSWFMKEGDVIVSVPSFFRQVVSYECIQAMEPTSLYSISHSQLQHIYKTFPEFNFIGRVLTERYYTLSEERLYSLRMQRTVERFRHLMDTNPELVQRVPSKYLASYLGVREETLSRMKWKR